MGFECMYLWTLYCPCDWPYPLWSPSLVPYFYTDGAAGSPLALPSHPGLPSILQLLSGSEKGRGSSTDLLPEFMGHQKVSFPG